MMNDDEHNQAEPEINFAAMCACFNIRKAARAVTNLYDSVLQPTGLRSTQSMLLMAIATVPKPPMISQLAQAMVMDRTTVGRELKPLVEQGLVQITEGSDRRTRRVQLTDAGWVKRREIIPYWQQVQEQLIAAGIGYDRWSQLRNDLEDVVRHAQE